MSRLAPLLIAAAGALPLALACADCRGRTSGAGGAASTSSTPPLTVEPPPLPEPLTWQELHEARGIGVPGGCRLSLPIHRAKLPARQVRFASARSDVAELAFALAAPGQRTVTQSGFVGLAPRAPRALPWFELDQPPALDRTPKGWVAAFTRISEDGKPVPVVWSEHAPPRRLAGGDRLAVADLLCHGATCAVLTTLARAVAAPGATVHLGVPDSNAARVDVEADPAVPWQPLAITSFDGSEARVALMAPKAVALWSVTRERTSKLSELETEFGVYDASSAKSPLIVAPGAPTNEPCKADQFPIRILGPEGKTSVVHSQAAPESLIVRTLDRGAILLWVAPISCNNAGRTLVYAALVDPSGAPSGSVMSVADATGFAAATHGSELALWLRTEDGLSFVKAECGAP